MRQQFLLLLTDIFSLFLAIVIIVILRYGFDIGILIQHFEAFSIIFILWLIVFYSFQLYEKPLSKIQYYQNYLLANFVNLLIAVLFFYFTSSFYSFGITPKRTLFLIMIFFIIVDIFLRKRLIFSHSVKDKIIFEDSKEWGDIYVIDLSKPNSTEKIYNLLKQGKTVMSLSRYQEYYLGKIALEELNYEIVNLKPESKSIFDFLRRIFDITLASIIALIFLPLIPFIILGIKISSAGPVLYKDKRVGFKEKVFYLYKFRTMHQTTVEFSQNFREEKQKRIFWFGKILRTTHIDELPQIINVLMGDISLVGPRPDSLKYYNYLKEQIPYYALRTIVKPGITGWAQIKGIYGDSIKEAEERLRYDLYYIKYRNPIFDFLIILKTISILLRGK